MIPAPYHFGVDMADGPSVGRIVAYGRPIGGGFSPQEERIFLLFNLPFLPSPPEPEPPMPKKFSDLVVADLDAIADVVAAREALRLAEAAVKKTTAAVIEALDTQPSHKAAIVNPDGTVSVYSSLYGSYYVSTISGDFEIVEPTPEPEPEPEPEPSDEDDEDLDDEDFDDEDDEDLDDEDEDEDFRL